jgi:hypothetical protein
MDVEPYEYVLLRTVADGLTVSHAWADEPPELKM